MEMHATVLGVNDVLQHISACSLFLQLGRRKLYRVVMTSVLRPRDLLLKSYTTFLTKSMNYCCFLTKSSGDHGVTLI
jgi:hypothetical protein